MRAQIRRRQRKTRGEDLEPELTDRVVILGYRGLDGVVRRTILQFTPRPQSLAGDGAQFEIALGPKQVLLLSIAVGC